MFCHLQSEDTVKFTVNYTIINRYGAFGFTEEIFRKTLWSFSLCNFDQLRTGKIMEKKKLKKIPLLFHYRNFLENILWEHYDPLPVTDHEQHKIIFSVALGRVIYQRLVLFGFSFSVLMRAHFSERINDFLGEKMKNIDSVRILGLHKSSLLLTTIAFQ